MVHNAFVADLKRRRQFAKQVARAYGVPARMTVSRTQWATVERGMSAMSDAMQALARAAKSALESSTKLLIASLRARHLGIGLYLSEPVIDSILDAETARAEDLGIEPDWHAIHVELRRAASEQDRLG
jgi:hypothetical protein